MLPLMLTTAVWQRRLSSSYCKKEIKPLFSPPHNPCLSSALCPRFGDIGTRVILLWYLYALRSRGTKSVTAMKVPTMAVPLIVSAIGAPKRLAIVPISMLLTGPTPILSCHKPIARPLCSSATFNWSMVCSMASNPTAIAPTPVIRNSDRGYQCDCENNIKKMPKNRKMPRIS